MQILTLAQWRKLRGLSQEEMAKKVNVSTRTIWSYENDINNLRNASYNTISLIANALEIRTGQIFLGDNFGKPNKEKEEEWKDYKFLVTLNLEKLEL